MSDVSESFDLSSNGATIEFTDEMFAPMVESSKVFGNPAELRRRLARDGYLLLRKVLNPELVLGIRASYFALLPAGYLKAGSEPVEGLFSGSVPSRMPDHGTRGHPAYEFVRSEEFRSFTELPELLRIAELLLGGPSTILPRRILRHFSTACRRASRAHTDFAYMGHGTDQLVTMWIPLGNCKPASGGLVYLEDSVGIPEGHLAAVQGVTDRPGDHRPLSHDLEWTARALGRRWLWADFEPGDVAIHAPHTVHASLDTRTESMRLSADIRFCRSDLSFDNRWRAAWAGDDGF